MTAPITLTFTKGDTGGWKVAVEIAGVTLDVPRGPTAPVTDGDQADRATQAAVFLELAYLASCNKLPAAIEAALITRRFDPPRAKGEPAPRTTIEVPAAAHLAAVELLAELAEVRIPDTFGEHETLLRTLDRLVARAADPLSRLERRDAAGFRPGDSREPCSRAYRDARRARDVAEYGVAYRARDVARASTELRALKPGRERVDAYAWLNFQLAGLETAAEILDEAERHVDRVRFRELAWMKLGKPAAGGAHG